MLTYLITGTLLGLAAAISPGPLLVLVISETVKHGRINGIKVALAPLITDFPVTIIFLLVLSGFQDFNIALGIISFIGALYLIFLSYESFTAKKLEINTELHKPRSLQKGILVNYLNPHIYIFWFTIGCPIILKAYKESIYSSIVFMLSFYFFIIGTKILIAILINKFQDYIINNIYVIFNKIMGFLLFIFSAWFIFEGLKYFQII